MKAKFTTLQRIHNRLWTELSKPLTQHAPSSLHSVETSAKSISGSHPWIDVCAGYADGKITSKRLRRFDAVREIVETLGATDGRHFAKIIEMWDPLALRHEAFKAIDSWGDPIRWPGLLLGTPSPCSPTSLRYLAHALWMKRNGYIADNGEIIEIGVGFGGLAAINSWISGATTFLVDLPDVVRAATKMLKETSFTHAAVKDPPLDGYCVISNYAFTELSASLQEMYFAKYIRSSARGVILSNAAVFAKEIGGRQDADLVSWFRREGLDARLMEDDPILCPSDHFHGNTAIVWG